jgi:hypothetical protein
VLSRADMAQEADHVEVVIELSPDGDRARVIRWLQDHGLDALPLVVGVLAMGEREQFARAFGVDPGDNVPVPDELREHVTSIAPVPSKDWHEGA